MDRRSFDVDAIALDLDGTLLDTARDLATAIDALLAGIALPGLSLAQVTALIGKGMANLVGRAVQASGGTFPEDAEPGRLLARYQVRTVVGGDDAIAKKPDAAPLLLVAQLLGVTPDRLLVVGDSINDAQSARAAGCPVLLVDYGYDGGTPVASIDCDGIIGSIAELRALLRNRVAQA
ncbi:MAG TPA: HAD-IA family hydrolase [Casimicrobiaceae bacterium]|nr:HAD-IA family hydrolase [Casimicrobiaceae bacterium]